MDDFKRASARTIGPGGMKCPCCNDYHTRGNHQKKIPGLSKLRRSRMKQELTNSLMQEQPCEHWGCLNHVSHPCEGCGRIAGESKPEQDLGEKCDAHPDDCIGCQACDRK